MRSLITITITIPATYVPALAAELVRHYGMKAETISNTIAATDDLLHALCGTGT